MYFFAATIFLGAFLLFQVQPLIAALILPWFGGGPGVWTVCLLFFQACLLAGYAYAHWSSRALSARAQVSVHVALLLGALAFLPLAPSANWKPHSDADPTLNILLLLLACLGLPYFVLAATGPLLQAWYNRSHPGVNPYRLYALSNLGSLLALVTYPFVFEPALTRHTQAQLWSRVFVLFVPLCGACAWQLWHAASSAEGGRKPAQPASLPPETSPPTMATKAQWLLLPACASVLLLSTTNKLCLDVAAVPFLWILPLGLYLLTFIICFDRPSWYRRGVFSILLLPLLGALCILLYQGSKASLWPQVLVLGGCLFAGSMVCHGEVYRLKPAPQFLTTFYLCIAAGGAAGGVFVTVLAPLLFHSYAELNWGVWLLAALLWAIHWRDNSRLGWRGRSWPLAPSLLAGVVLLGGIFLWQSFRGASQTLSTTRNFYGVLRVIEGGGDGPMHGYKLNHGGITHGMQFANPVRAGLPTMYYHQASGVARVLNNFPRRDNRRVGVVGLGIGTLAAYGRSGDTFRFYEIDPAVRQLAVTGFSFLKNSAATVEVIPGDARLSLEREVSQQYDVLVLDAFTSDAVPVHLLTREAFQTYFRHLKPDGVIVVHASNRHLDFLPVVTGIAKHFRLMLMCLDWDEPARPWWFSSSRWIVVSRNQSFMCSEALLAHASLIPDREEQKVVFWTDDYSSLLGVIKR